MAVNGLPATEVMDPDTSAEVAGLRYVTDEAPGIRRRRTGKGMSYRRPSGEPIGDRATLRRIRSLAIPPAWTDVWICADRRGHLQATGRDAKGRKQYRYHPRWREVRDAVKYDRLVAFAEALPRIRERVDEDLAVRGVPRERVLATVVRLLEETLIRIGNDEYRRQNHSFGLTTLRNRHVDVEGGTIRFHFRGKHGKAHHVRLADRRLARVVRRCREIPGQELFQYVDDEGQRHTIGSADVNVYLREISGEDFTAEDFTAKDFRTWAGTMLAARFFRASEPGGSDAAAHRQVIHTIEQVAAELGNTVAVCRKCYVHRAIVEAYLAGSLTALNAVKAVKEEVTAATGGEERAQGVADAAGTSGLSAEEQAVLGLLRSAEAGGGASQGWRAA
ncbi:MAG: DNA topoisomerase IB [Chloroflexota bacterium]